MRSGAACAALLGASLACGSSILLGCGSSGDVDSGPPVLSFDTAANCDDPASCLGGGVEEYEVSGVRVLHKSLPGHPLVAVQLSFVCENLSGKQAWAEWLALALFNLSGSRRFTSSTWSAEQLKHGASIFSYRGVDYAYIDLLAPLPSWRAVWELIVESVPQPNQTDYDLDFYRTVQQRNFTSEGDDAATAASLDAFTRQFHGDDLNLLRDTPEALVGVSLSDVAIAWHELFERHRLLVTVVGDVDRRSVEAAVSSLASWLYPDAVSWFPRQRPPAVTLGELAVLQYVDSPTWYIDSYFRGPAADNPDYVAFALGLDVLDQRLFREVRDVRGLAYTTGAAASFYRNSYGHLWLASASPREALPVVRQIVSDLESLGPDEDELARARARLRMQTYGYADEPSGLAALISDWQLTAGDYTAMQAFLSALEQTGPAQVAAALSGYLRSIKTVAAGGGSELSEAELRTLFASP